MFTRVNDTVRRTPSGVSTSEEPEGAVNSGDRVEESRLWLLPAAPVDFQLHALEMQSRTLVTVAGRHAQDAPVFSAAVCMDVYVVPHHLCLEPGNRLQFLALQAT